jgi:thiol-disulfide isomerase/thioredoxin
MLFPDFLLLLVLGIFIYFIVNAHLKESYETNNETNIYLFYAPWCSYSQNFLLIWDRILKNKKEYPKNVNFVKVNIDQNPDKAKLYNIKQVPKIMIESKKDLSKVPSSSLTSYDKFHNYLTISIPK